MSEQIDEKAVDLALAAEESWIKWVSNNDSLGQPVGMWMQGAKVLLDHICRLRTDIIKLEAELRALRMAKFTACSSPGAILVVEDRSDMESIPANPNACHPHLIMHGVAFRDDLEKAEQALAEARAGAFEEAAKLETELRETRRQALDFQEQAKSAGDAVDKAEQALKVALSGRTVSCVCGGENTSLKRELELAGNYAAEIAQGVTHYPHEIGEPCVRCDSEQALAEAVEMLTYNHEYPCAQERCYRKGDKEVPACPSCRFLTSMSPALRAQEKE